MASDYLLRKWRVWFKILDRKHTGKLTRADEKRDEEAFVNMSHLEGQRKEEAIKTFHKFWDKFIFHGGSEPVTEEQFITMTMNDFRTNKGKFIEEIKQSCEADIKVIDGGGKGYITEEEYIIANKALGLDNEEWNKTYVKAFNPVGGKIPCNVILDAWMEFLVGEDGSKKDFVLDAFEKYPDL